jgi:hypothetical protein
MKRVLFSEPPIVHESLTHAMEARKARRISNVLRCIKKLRPDWDGSVLPRDCLDYIGRMGAQDIRNCDLTNAVTLRFHIEFDCEVQFDMTGFESAQFDSVQRVLREIDEGLNKEYEQFTITFYWWPHIGTLRNAYEQVTAYVMSLIPERLLDDHRHGADSYDEDEGLLAAVNFDIFSPDDDTLELVSKGCKKIEAALWFGKLEDEDDLEDE